MCLIMYSPDGTLPSERTFQTAAKDNPDGIGIMSERAVVKFLGRKATRKAWRHINRLSRDGIPFGVHFRWRTHGEINDAQTHPHRTALGSYLMHNGVLGATSRYATAEQSDTALYAEWYLSGISDWRSCLALVEDHIGTGNKFLVMDESKEFHVLNEWCGVNLNGLWYSNDFSFDYEDQDDLMAQNDGYEPWGNAVGKYGTTYTSGSQSTAMTATVIKSALTTPKKRAPKKPNTWASSEEWFDYYTALEEFEAAESGLMSWEREERNDDFDYSDRNVSDAIKRGAP